MQQQEKKEEERRMCRVCLDVEGEDEEQNAGQLVRVCPCDGSSKYIHDKCLSQWIDHSGKKTCPNCKFRVQFTKKKEWKLKPMSSKERELFLRDVALNLLAFPFWTLANDFFTYCDDQLGFHRILYYILYNILAFLWHYFLSNLERNEYYSSAPWTTYTRVFTPYRDKKKNKKH